MTHYYDANGWHTDQVLPDRATDIAPPDGQLSDGIAWNFTGYTWVALPINPVQPKPIVPAKVTRRQARQALLLAGKLSMVEPAINAIPDATQRAMIMIEWQDSLEFERTRPSLVALATAIGMTSADLDTLFVQASKL